MIKVQGLEELTKRLDKLANNASRLNGTHAIKIGELFTPDFLSRHSAFSSINDFFKAGNFTTTQQADIENIPDGMLDEHTRAVTSFSNWKEFLAAALREWSLRQLSL